MKLLGFGLIWILIWSVLGGFFNSYHIITHPAWWSFFGAVMGITGIFIALYIDSLPPKQRPDPYKCPSCGSNLAYVGAPCVNDECPEYFSGLTEDKTKANQPPVDVNKPQPTDKPDPQPVESPPRESEKRKFLKHEISLLKISISKAHAFIPDIKKAEILTNDLHKIVNKLRDKQDRGIYREL